MLPVSPAALLRGRRARFLEPCDEGRTSFSGSAPASVGLSPQASPRNSLGRYWLLVALPPDSGPAMGTGWGSPGRCPLGSVWKVRVSSNSQAVAYSAMFGHRAYRSGETGSASQALPASPQAAESVTAPCGPGAAHGGARGVMGVRQELGLWKTGLRPGPPGSQKAAGRVACGRALGSSDEWPHAARP